MRSRHSADSLPAAGTSPPRARRYPMSSSRLFALLLLAGGCVAAGAVRSDPAVPPGSQLPGNQGAPSQISEPPPQSRQPGRQQPPVAQQKEFVPSESLLRGSAGLPYLDADELKAMVTELASPAFEGRLTGTAGFDRAARWAAERFREAGLQPGGANGTYFQPFRVEANEVTGPTELRVAHGTWEAPAYRFGEDYIARGFTGSGRVENAPVVFAGYGLGDPEKGWNDWEGVDATGAVVLIFMGTPPGTGDWGERSRPRWKATEARQHGARAVLLIDDPGPSSPTPIGSVYHGQDGEHQADMPVLSIRERVADDLLRGTPHTASSLRAWIAEEGRPVRVRMWSRVTVEAHARYEPSAVTWNVVGWLEGSDPAVSGEYVVVGGHLDHVGTQAGLVFAGAKDNAAGSVMVTAAARAMSSAPVRPRRSVCFVLFAGEELFLLGSEYFAQNPPRPLSQAVGMVNLDVVGVGPSLSMEGGETNPLFQQMAADADRLYGGFDLAARPPTPARAGAGAHSAVVQAGGPTGDFHSGGAEGRVHTPADVADTIDFAAYHRTTVVVYLTIFQMADRP